MRFGSVSSSAKLRKESVEDSCRWRVSLSGVIALQDVTSRFGSCCWRRSEFCEGQEQKLLALCSNGKSPHRVVGSKGLFPGRIGPSAGMQMRMVFLLGWEHERHPQVRLGEGWGMRRGYSPPASPDYPYSSPSAPTTAQLCASASPHPPERCACAAWAAWVDRSTRTCQTR